MNTFLLSFSPFDTKISGGQISTFIVNHRKILQWYMPFAGTYVFKSSDDLISLTPTFRGIFDGNPFILSQVFPIMMGGAQGDSIWNWLNTNELPALSAN